MTSSEHRNLAGEYARLAEQAVDAIAEGEPTARFPLPGRSGRVSVAARDVPAVGVLFAALATMHRQMAAG